VKTIYQTSSLHADDDTAPTRDDNTDTTADTTTTRLTAKL